MGRVVHELPVQDRLAPASRAPVVVVGLAGENTTVMLPQISWRRMILLCCFTRSPSCGGWISTACLVCATSICKQQTRTPHTNGTRAEFAAKTRDARIVPHLLPARSTHLRGLNASASTAERRRLRLAATVAQINSEGSVPCVMPKAYSASFTDFRSLPCVSP